jgi:hypothetical protein
LVSEQSACITAISIDEGVFSMTTHPPPPDGIPPYVPPAPAVVPPYDPAPPPVTPNTDAAVLSLRFALAAWSMSACAIFVLSFDLRALLLGAGISFLLALVAIISGHIALARIPVSHGRQRGAGTAFVGLVLGYLDLALAVLIALSVIFLYIAFANG